jgi:hypothetical protein
VEIEVPRRFALTAIVILVVLLLYLIGQGASPRDAAGHPLLLSPQRRAVLHYLNRCRDWAGRLEILRGRLDRLTPAANGDRQPAASAGDLYRLTQQAQDALDDAALLLREVEQTGVPAPMTGVYNLAIASAQAHLAWAEAVNAYIGAPSAQAAQDLAAKQKAAHNALDAFIKALEEITGNESG